METVKKIAFITTFCPHHRQKTFEILGHYHDTDYYFFSAGDDWYWQKQHGVRDGNFHYEYLPGFRLGGSRFTPSLPWKLWKKDYDAYIKCINGRFALPITYLVARLKRKPFILWTGIWMRLNTPVHRLLFPITRYIYQHADALVVYGEHVKQYLIGEGVAVERIFVTTHAVDNATYNQIIPDAEKVALQQRLQLTPEQKVILYLGRLEEGKGLPYLLEAFASLPHNNTVLVLAGTGSKKSSLEQLARKLEIADRIRFPGYIQPEQTVTYYSIAWVCVLPSVTTPTFKEPWGLVVNEALNQGLPVIATAAVGAAAGGLVQDGTNGLVVPERDSKALSVALERILNDPDLRGRMAHNARQIIASWDNERMIKGFLQAIDFVSNPKIGQN